MKKFSKELQFDMALTILLKTVEEVRTNDRDYNIALGEIMVAGVNYQIQLSLVADKKIWLEEDETRMSQVVKIHP